MFRSRHNNISAEQQSNIKREPVNGRPRDRVLGMDQICRRRKQSCRHAEYSLALFTGNSS